MELFSTIIAWYMAHINYLTITILMAIESTFIPLPSELVVPPAAWLAAQGQMSLFFVIFFSSLGCVIGAIINYTLSFYLGRQIIYGLADSKLAKLFFINKTKIEHAEQYFRNNGNTSTFIGRLIPGIRHLISIPAGLAKMNLKKFILFTFIGSGLWNIVLALLGFSIARVFPDIKNAKDVATKATQYSHEISYITLGIGIVFVIYLIVKNRKRIKNKS